MTSLMGPLPRSATAHTVAAAATFVLITVIAVLAFVLPDGRGQLLANGAQAALIFFTVFGPVIRGARPWRPWVPFMMGGLLLSLGLAMRCLGPHPGVLLWATVAFVAAYISFALWLMRILREIGNLPVADFIIDAFAAAFAVMLLLPMLPTIGTTTPAPGAAIFPIFDALALTLGLHLARTIHHASFAWGWGVAALLVQLALDLHYYYSGATLDLLGYPFLSAGYLYPMWAIAMVAWHPSVEKLFSLPTRPHELHAPGWGTTVIYLAIIPGVIGLSLPDASATGETRTMLVFLLIGLLAFRLVRSLVKLRKAQQYSHERATRDQLTGLLNRSAMLDSLADMLTENGHNGTYTTLIFVDCDNFKGVNDTWGHPAGDTLLQNLGTMMRQRIRPDDLLARHGGDEFVVAATVASPQIGEQLAQRLQRFFAESSFLVAPGVRHATTASMGVAVAGPHENLTPTGLLGRADAALYAAKGRGRAQYAVYDADLDRATRHRSHLAAMLRGDGGLARISVELQPIFTGHGYSTLYGWEALARWYDPDLGDVPAEVFVPLAEELGLVANLDEHVMTLALPAFACLREHYPEATLSLNVSSARLRQPDFPESVIAGLAAHGIPSQRFGLEAMESVFMGGGASEFANLTQLREAGVSILMDNFGTGHASLTTLLESPIDGVKIDRTLTSRLGTTEEGSSQLRAILGLLRRLEIGTVIAVGVEEEEQALLLHDLGCQLVQGWLFGRTRPPEQFADGADLVNERQRTMGAPLSNT